MSSRPVTAEDTVYSTIQGPQLTQPLLLLNDQGKFVKEHDISSMITSVFRGYNNTIEYRWSHLNKHEQKLIFDTRTKEYDTKTEEEEEFDDHYYERRQIKGKDRLEDVACE